jgi:hypothetical protein
MLTVPKPVSETEMEWRVQEWVKTHGFNGAHIVLTEDTGITRSAGALSIGNGTSGKIDESSSKAKTIKDQMMKYAQEQSGAAQEKKIKELQQTGAQTASAASMLKEQAAITNGILMQLLKASDWNNATQIIKAVKAPPAWPEPLKAEIEPSELNPKRVNAHIAKGRRFR